jgi:hypothetical protein
MNTLNIKENQVAVLQAVTPYNGANLDHYADQKFYLMFGMQDSSNNEVNFKKVCSFTLLDPNRIQLESCNNQGRLYTQDLEVLKRAIQLVSYRLIEMVCSDEGELLWGTDVPTPTELVEAFLTKKTFIFSSMLENSGRVYMDEIKDWKKQAKRFTKVTSTQMKLLH